MRIVKQAAVDSPYTTMRRARIQKMKERKRFEQGPMVIQR